MTGNANWRANKKKGRHPAGGCGGLSHTHTRTWDAWQGVSNGGINNAGLDGLQTEHA